VSAHFRCRGDLTDKFDPHRLVSAAQAAGVRHIVTAYAPVGPIADELAQLGLQLASEGVTLSSVRRDWDTCFWPHATKGFFPFKERIPGLLQSLGMP
jgi:deoxyribodipyrimidine photo-lyase